METNMKQTVSQDSPNGFSYANDHSSRSNSIAFSAYGSAPGDFTPTHHPSSTFGSPALDEMDSTYGSAPFSNIAYGNGGVGLGLQWNGSYVHQSEVLPTRTDDPNCAIAPQAHLGFPPTPRSSDSESARQMGSARSSSTGFEGSPTTLKSTGDVVPVTKTTKTRRPKNNKTATTKTPKINAPLSELTKDMDVALRDMEAWVNRPTEERQKEVEKRKGYVTRPMNSFMLYRSAYAERTKVWCLQNNHQIVSAVSGESWPLEPPDIREKYNELARIERENHAKAHPTYKFSPSKLGANGTRRRKDAEGADGEDYDMRSSDDGEWRPSRGPNTKRRKSVAGPTDESAYYSPPHSPLSVDNTPFGSYNNTITHPTTKALPSSMPSSFFDYTFQPSHELSSAMMHDMRVRNVPSPALAAQQQQILAAQQQQHTPAYTLQPLAGLPAGTSKYQPHNGLTVHDFSSQMDPSLPIFGDNFTHTTNNPLVVTNDGSAANYNPEVFSFEESAHPAFTDSFFANNNHAGHYEDMLNQQL